MGQYADEYLKARLAGASGDQARSQAYYSTHDSGTPMAPKENPYSILQLGVQNGDIVERNGRYFLNEDSPNAAAASAAARASANMDPKSAYEKYVERYNQVLASTPGTTAARKAQETYNQAYETAKAKNASGSTLAQKIGQAAFGTAELIRHWDEIAGNKAKNQSEEEKKAASEAVARKYEEKKAQGASNMEALLSAIREASNEATQEKSPEYLRAMEQIRADAAKAIPKINEASKTAAKIENVAEGWAQGRIGADLTAIGSTLYKGIGKLAGATDEQIGSVTGAIKDIGNAKQMQGQAMQNAVTDNMGKLGRFGVNVATTMADVYADAAINAATGGFGGLTALGIRSFGNGVSEAMNEGKSEEQQMLTGLKSAVIEVGTELIGGPFEGAYGRSLLSTATNKAVTRLASTPAGRAGLKILYNGLEEGFEEALSGILNPLADRLLGLSDTTDFDVSEIIYETLLGAATGAIGGAGQIVRGSGVYKGNAQEIVDFAREKGNERLANELQAKLDSEGQLSVNDVQDLMASAGTGKNYEQKVREFQQEQQQKAEQQTARMLEAAKKEQSAERARQDFRSRENFTDEEMGLAVENKAVEFRTADGRTAQIGDFKISEDGTLQAEMELSDGEAITRDADDLTEHLPEANRKLITEAKGLFGKQAALVLNEYEAGQNVADYILATDRALNMLAAYGATAEDMKKDPVISGVLTDGQITKFATVGAVIGQQRQAKVQQRAAELENIAKIAEAIESAGPEQGVAEETEGWEQAVSDVRSYMNDIRTEITSLTAAMGSMEEGTEEYTAAEARLGQMKGYLADATEQYHSFTEKLAELKGRTFERRKRGTISFEGDPARGLDGVDIGKMSTKQKQALAAIEAITDAAAIDVVIYDAAMKNGQGEKTGAPRGFFNPADGKIYLNINDTADNGRVLVMSTFSHELTHFIQKYSPDAYEELKEFVIRQYFNGNTELFTNRVTRLMQENANTGMTADQAADEIVADSCSEMLLDSEAVRTLAREHYTLAEKIAEFIQKLCSKIRAAFTDRFEGKQFPAIARGILQDVETMQKIWDKGLIQAEHNRAAQELVNRKLAAEEKENAAGDGDVQFMKYETRDDGIEVYETSPEVKNLSWKEKKNRFRQFMENEYRGRTAKFVRNGHAYYARFEYRDIRKNIYGDNDSDQAGKDAKINAGADGDIFDLVENSEYIGSLAERNIADNAHGATKSWDYYIKTVQIDDRVFDLLANVRRPESGEYVYNIELYENNKIKAASPSSQAFTATSVRGPTASADTIAQQEQEGKEKILEQRYEAWDEDHPALVAVHNKSVNGVRRMLERNGVPFPSIAIKKAGTKHVGFGDVSIVFPRSTIDPAANRENRLYSNDAWTPTEPRTEYDIGSTREYREKLKGIIGADVYSALRANSRMEETGMTDAIESANGNVFEAVKKFPELKYAWKKSIGEEPASGYTEEDLDGFHRHTNDELVSVFKEVDGGKIEHLTYNDKETLGKIADVLNEHFLNGIDNKIKRDYFAKNLPYTAEDINPYVIRDAYTKYRNNNYGIGKVLDGRALESALRADKETENDPAYRKWVENFFEGIIKDSGIPNGKSIYTDSGNRRSFKARHVDATLENIVKEMRKQKETGNGVFDVNLRGAATKAYNSVEEMRAESGRLLGEHVSDDVFDSYMNEFGERLYDLAFSAVKHKRDTNDFSYGDAEKNILLEAIRDGKTKSGMRKILLQNSQWIDYSEELADGLWQLKQDVQNMPAPYFEAKPRRIVTPDEALAYIMPDNADRDVIDELGRRGLSVLTYRADDEEDRLEKLNSIPDAQFQRFEDPNQMSLFDDAQDFFRQMDLFEETGEMPAAQAADGFDEELQERVASGKLHPDVAKDLKWRRDTARELKKFFDGSRFVSDEDIDDMLGTSAWADEDRNRLLEEIWDEYKNRGADRMETWKLTEKILNDPNTEQGDKFAYTDEDFNRWYWRRNYKTQPIDRDSAVKYLGWNGKIGLKTYTDDGEVEYARANIYVPEAEDVQYQQYEAGDTAEQELIDRQKALNTIRAESAALRDAQQAIAKILQETGNRLKVSEEKQVKEADARKMAKRLIRQWSSTADVESVTQELRTIGNMAVQGADFESIKAKARDVASYIVSTSEEEDEGYDPTAYNAVRDILKGGVRVDDAHKPTDFNEWRKANFGRITIKNNGMTVDEAYAAAREALGNGMDGILPEDIAQGDMLDTLMNALEILGPTKSNRYARHIGEFAESLANDIVADAVENSAMQLDETLADRFGGKRLERAAGPVRRELEEAAALAAERTEAAESALQAAERTITQAESETRRRVAEARADERRTAAEAAAQAAEAAGEEKKAAVEKAREQERKKAQKKLDSAKKRLSTLRDEKNARIAQIREEAQAEKAEAVAREKAAKWQKVKEVSDYYRNQAKNAAEKRKESAGAAKYRKRIQTRALKLMDWLEKNSQKEHVPEALKGPLANFLQSISFESKRSLGGGDRTQNDERMASRMGKLAEILEQQNRYQNGAENVLGITERYIDLPEGIVERLKDIQQTATRMMEQGDSYTINEMTAEELKDLDEILKAISHAVTEMNNLAYNGRYHSVIDLAEDSLSELEDKPEIRISLVRQGDKKNAAADINDFLSFSNAVPYYAFKRYGDAAFSIFDGIRRGWGRFAENLVVLDNFTSEVYTPEQAKAWIRETHDFTLASGEKITMTAAEMMSFYELSKREQALKHIFGGGIRTGKSTEHHVMSLSDIAMINAALTEQQKKVADTLQGFLGGTCSEWGNEISMARFGIRQFGEENYFPIETDDTDRNAIDPQAKKNDLYRLLNVGFTKRLNVHANNTLIVSDIFDVFANHTSDMAKLNGLGLPILDAIKWFNYREKETLPTGQIRTRSMQRAIERAYGKGGTGYFTQFMKDLNGVREGGLDEGRLKAIISNYKVAQIGANLRVVIQQPTSIARASMEIAPKYLAKGVFTKGGYEEMMNSSGLAKWKIKLGFYDINVNRSMRERIKNTATWKENLQEKATELAGKADEITWTAMWNACRAEQKDLHPDFSHTELMQATTERFENLMLATQVMDSTISRSQIMRGGELGLAEYTGFMSEPTMSWNMLSQNFLQFRDDWRKNGYAAAWKKHGGRLAKAVTVFAASAALTSAVAAIADAARDDDEYANWLQKWMSHFGDNFYDNAKPWGLLPIVSQLAEVFEYKVFDIGYSPDGSMLTDGINALIDAAKLMFEDRKKYTDWGIAYKAMQAASMLSGIPAAALGREIVAVINSGIQTYNELMGEKTGEKVPLIKTYRPDPKYAIKDAYEAGYISDEEAQQALVDEGAAKDETAAGKTVYGWTNQTPAGGTVYDSLYTAVREGNGAEVNRILSDMYAHGYSEDTVQNKLKTEIRGWYVNPQTQFSKQDAVNALMTYCGMDTVSANQKCSYWFFMNEHPEANTDGKGENPKQGELAPALIRAEQSGELSHADAQTIWAGCNNWKTTYDEYLNGVRR